MTHNLKTVNPYFSSVWQGFKKFEIRENDRNFQEGDEIYLKEYDAENNTYSGREIRAEITYILGGYKALKPEYVVFSFKVTQFINKTPNN